MKNRTTIVNCKTNSILKKSYFRNQPNKSTTDETINDFR